MAPRPEERASTTEPMPTGGAADGDRVVISGMAGLYPRARYVSDLQRILYDKVNPITEDGLRWKYYHPEVPQFAGSVAELDHFDAQFFKVHYRLGITMDAMSRKILEQTFEAIYDAGVNPEQLSGRKIGVFVGSCFSETEKACFYATSNESGLGIAGCSKSMFANRISYWLNAKGPSMTIDQSCSSSTAALEIAHKAIMRGECEAAVVGAGYVSLHPQSSVHLGRIMSISMDGKTKAFSEDANGCAKSEAVNVLFLQKAKDAKRIYAEVIHVKSEYLSLLEGDIGPRYGFYRNPEVTANFLKEFYKEAGVSPTQVEYVEAFGSAVLEADKSELDSIEKVLCNGREEPLLVGSVMSNIGYAEAASGISAITKVLLGYHTGSLAANLHCAEPRRDVRALLDGRMHVLTEHAAWRRTYAAVNSLSVTGVNAHVLLHGRYQHKEPERYRCDMPRLVTLSNRQETGVERAIDILKSHPVDPEELALLHSIHETNISGHLGKGYVILATNVEGKTISLGQSAEYSDGARRPLWFVYSGMGSQWAGMGAQLMRVPIFAAAIERCRKVLEPRGVDIVHIITTPDKSIFDNILHSFVGIAAVQIGLTDILRELGLVPDNIIGHSVGELGCAYADGCLTAEEMILAAYSRGRVSLETPFIRGAMAAVGLGAQQVTAMCPPEIEVACHNSAESCTVSGPADAMRAFVADLSARGVFAKEVPCSNIAYHSRYIAEAGPGLLRYLQEVIPEPRERSPRWVSSSVPRERWHEPAAQYSSAEYHTNNLLSPVLFEEASALIPADAVLVEVAPHGLLQAILKRALPASCSNVPLTRRGHSDGVTMLLDAIGKLYVHGFNPTVRVLYPEVSFPVSTGTPLLSHYVEWAHKEKWLLPGYQLAIRTKAASSSLIISMHDSEYKYLEGHVISNKTLLPFSFALVAVWDTLAMSLNVPKKSPTVEFSNVKLFAQPLLLRNKITKLNISIHRGSGLFEIVNEDFKVASGFIRVIPLRSLAEHDVDVPNDTPCKLEPCDLRLQDVYEALYERGYNYRGEFLCICGSDNAITDAKISWNNNWVTLIDAMVQLQTLKYTHSGISIPEYIRRMVINPVKLLNSTKNCKDHENKDISLIDVTMCAVQDRARCEGIVIENMRFRDVREIGNKKTILETLKFIPRHGSTYDISTSLHVLLQIIAENLNKDNMNVMAINAGSDDLLFKQMEILAKKRVAGMEVLYHKTSIDAGVNDNARFYENVDLILVRNLSRNEKINQRLHRILPQNMFIINEESIAAEATEVFPMNFYNVVSVIKNDETKLELARWKAVLSAPLTAALTVRGEADLALLARSRTSQGGLLVLAEYPPPPGLLPLLTEWRRDPSSRRIHVIMQNGNPGLDNHTDEVPSGNLTINIFNDGVWGGEYFLPVSEEIDVEKESETLKSEVAGDIETLRWVSAPRPAGPGTLVHVHYAGLNTNDMRRAFGLKLIEKKNQGYGMDFSGVTERGERVMGVAPCGAASSLVLAAPELTWPVPAHWTLEDAATVPFAYMFTYYCLDIGSNMRIADKDEQLRVLVHGGAGALGQAAISVALARGARVFTTVRDRSKKTFLKKLFPQLNEEDIGCSRDPSFADMVLGATGGAGCHLVICCLKGELKNDSIKCCALFGCVMNTTQISHNDNYSFGWNNLAKEKDHVFVDITTILQDPGSNHVKALHSLVSAGIASGEVRPLTRAVFPPREAARALRLLAASHHRGRALLRLTPHEPATPAPRARASAEAAYEVVVCDSDRLGLQLVGQLIESGKTSLQLHFPSPTARVLYKLRQWADMGVRMAVEYGSLEQSAAVWGLLRRAAARGAVRGVLVVATGCARAELRALHDATTHMCPALESFVVITNDIYHGHSVCVQRAKSGLPATLLDVSELDTGRASAARALQRARRSGETVLRARTTLADNKSLMQTLASGTGCNISEDATDATLEGLGMPVEKSVMITSLLRDAYNVYVEENNVPQLTVGQLKQIEDNLSEPQLSQVEGLGTFYSYVERDELLASTGVVYLPTLTNNYQMRDDEFEGGQSALCIVPGLEGLHARFTHLAQRLKLPALVLQPGLDRPRESPRLLAAKHAQVIENGPPFYLLGYEAGVAVALELAAILEEYGLAGTVFCLGDGPEELRAGLRRELAACPDEAALQEAVAAHMLALMAPAAPAPVPGRAHMSWPQRVEATVRALRGHTPHTALYVRALLDAALARLEVARAELPAPRALRSRIVVLRVRGSGSANAPCSLARYSQEPLVLHELESPLAHAARDLRVPAIINSHLHEDVLRAFDEKNLCDSYLLNGKAFIAMPNKISDQPNLN